MSRTINKCIYCGSTSDLRDEHILPYSLWGTEVLKKSSCRACEQVTTKFERHVARELLLPVRAYMGYRSRRKSKLPNSFDLDVTYKDGSKKTLNLPAKEHPALIVFPEYAVPRLLRDGKQQQGINITGTRLIGYGADLLALQQQYGFSSLTHTITFKATNFEKFLAKWAYCTAVNQYGLEAFSKVYVLDDILGKTDTIGSYIGNVEYGIIGKRAALAAFHIAEDDNRRVAVWLKLFANSDSPEYLVIVGELNAHHSLK
jgi:hypothetical protein